MDWKLEVIVIPVTDVDAAKAFYADKVGFHLDHDNKMGDTARVVQLTPRGSGCSIAFGVGIGTGVPGAIPGLQLCVSDVTAARSELAERGVGVSPVQHFEEGQIKDGPGEAWNSFVFFQDPDGNNWTIQEVPHREGLD